MLHAALRQSFEMMAVCEMGGAEAEWEKRQKTSFYDKLFATNFVYLMVCFHPRMFKHFGKLSSVQSLIGNKNDFN